LDRTSFFRRDHSQTPTKENKMKKLYVGNLPFSATENDLESIFAQYGKLDSLTIVRDRESGQPRGFAFVEYGDDAAAEAAIAATNGMQVGGRALMVNEARPQAPRSGGGGGRGFGGGRPGGSGGRGGYGGGKGGNRGGGGGRGDGGRNRW
jgi:cold-inducible RNA-binding protein